MFLMVFYDEFEKKVKIILNCKVDCRLRSCVFTIFSNFSLQSIKTVVNLQVSLFCNSKATKNTFYSDYKGYYKRSLIRGGNFFILEVTSSFKTCFFALSKNWKLLLKAISIQLKLIALRARNLFSIWAIHLNFKFLRNILLKN